MDEGGRQFSLRQYEAARNAFISALSAKDTPKELLPTIRTSIAHCDSCIKYEQLTKGALIRIGELKKRDAVAQTDIVNYYGAAADFMRIVNKYNPSDYYSKNINMLETYIENMPLTLKFRFVKWVVNRVSAIERGPFPNIEVWACYDTTNPNPADYSSPRKFRKMVRSNAALYKLIGISDELGVVDMEFNRKSLPTGFFFRCASDNVDAPIVYKDMKNVMSSSEGEFNKRQFRQKITTQTKDKIKKEDIPAYKAQKVYVLDANNQRIKNEDGTDKYIVELIRTSDNVRVSPEMVEEQSKQINNAILKIAGKAAVGAGIGAFTNGTKGALVGLAAGLGLSINDIGTIIKLKKESNKQKKALEAYRKSFDEEGNPTTAKVDKETLNLLDINDDNAVEKSTAQIQEELSKPEYSKPASNESIDALLEAATKV